MTAFRAEAPEGRPLRVIQVGAGGMGQAWLQTVKADPDVELVGVVDLDLDTASAGTAAYGDPSLPVGRSLTELASSVAPDAVLDITVPVAHHPVTTEALFLGLPVLGEKPVAPTIAQSLSLAAAAEVTGELFMVSQSRRWNDQLVRLKQHAQALGRIGVVTTEFYKAPHFGGFREQMDDVLLLDMAIHPFDSARYLLGSEPVAVYCESYNPAWSWYRGDAAATALFEFEGGVRYEYDGSWCSPGYETSWNGSWRVSGEGGTALWNGDDSPVSAGSDEGLPVPAALPSVGDGIAGSLAGFTRALRTGQTPDGEVHGNIMSLAMVEAAITSKNEGRRILLDEILDAALVTAIADEQRDDVRARLRSWGSVREALALTPAPATRVA